MLRFRKVSVARLDSRTPQTICAPAARLAAISHIAPHVVLQVRVDRDGDRPVNSLAHIRPSVSAV